MRRRNTNVAAVTMAAAMVCSAMARGGTVIGDWQPNSLITDTYNGQTPVATGPNDGWFDWQLSNGGSAPTNDPGSDPTDNFPGGSSSTYTTYNYSTTTGVTLGTQSLKMTPVHGYSQNLSLKTQNQTDSEGNSELADFFNNTEFTIQVTYNATEWSPNAGAITGLTINAQTYGFQGQPVSNANNSIGAPNYDTGNATYPGTWDAKDYASPSTNGITSRTMTFSYANMLPGGSGNPAAVSSGDPTGTIPATASYVELIMANILYDNQETLIPGSFYYSDAQFTNTPVTTTWQAEQHAQGTSYNWGTINNFTPYSQATLTGGMPCNAGDTVTFGTNIPAGITETIDLNETRDFQISLGTMIFNNPSSSYLIDQGTGGSLTLNGNVTSPSGTVTAGTSTIADQDGNHTISAPVVLATNTTISVGQAANTFTISGNISGTGGVTVGSSTLALNAGTVAFSGLNTYSGGTTVGSGTLLINANGSKTTSALPTGPVTITGGKLALASNVTLGSQPTSTPASNVNITSLSISGNGTLDIGNNHIIINYGTGTDPIASIAAWVKSGYAAGAWNGPGIDSTAAQSNAASYGLGYADAADSGNPAGLGTGQIEVMYTLLGDANLDGKVNSIDFAILASNFNKAVVGSSGWDQGDFNYDGSINSIDFADLAGNFNKGASQSADVAALEAFASANGLLADVPEPASTALVALGAASILTRRRKRA